jgi:hypothetical protein
LLLAEQVVVMEVEKVLAAVREVLGQVQVYLLPLEQLTQLPLALAAQLKLLLAQEMLEMIPYFLLSHLLAAVEVEVAS